MAQVSDLPCNGDGICMVCNNNPATEETLTCNTCVTPWHVTCIRPESRPQSLSETAQWECPDCSPVNHPPPSGNPEGAGGSKDDSSGSLIAAIKAIHSDKSLSEQDKAKRRQDLLSGSAGPSEGDGDKKIVEGDNDLLRAVNKSLSCSICLQTLERPVTTPCGHNFCLKCFQKWIAQGKRSCANCRRGIPFSMSTQPRINAALVFAIRMAKNSNSNSATGQKVSHFVHNQDRPDKAFTSERAKKAGMANATSGKIFVTIPSDHFGPILKDNDPVRNQGVLVGESWEGRLECRQWGVHFPPVAGIAGQSAHGAQSVVLSGGYVDDEDHGEWFLYTGSGGRDLSGNKRTNKDQSFDQEFVKMNEALRVSCRNGYPVRVVRSFKEKRSSYAPDKGLRYDGIYRIETCWRKIGEQGYKVCRYLFVRCDNDPAPWSSDDNGDRPRPLPVMKELENAIDITERKGSPFWDYDEEKDCWVWKKPPPCSKKPVRVGNGVDVMKRRIKQQPQNSMRERLIKEFSCQVCHRVMTNPVTTPCAHNFCQACLEKEFSGQSFIKQRTCGGRRNLRSQKNVMKCPCCSTDIADFVQNPQVNREMVGIIESLQREISKSEEILEESSEETHGTCEKKDVVSDDAEDSEINTQILEAYEDGGDEALDLGTAKRTLLEQSDAVNDKMGVAIVEPKMVDNKELTTTLDQDLEPALQEGFDNGSNESMVGDEEMPKSKRAKIEVRE
ncbi:putative zinc finger protein [Tripterygium wilfordii]|uniref:RING-type E3 ubiquitin transferase n=1 Tax=Tripterygium wilfordii TaxID=458696 RepID=A0A7J7D4H2_TRIWF|nr:E3 ubiquitin-protein ligase ORTHRUS 2-like [Tripterygium wilfordii]KAF5741221.1 putative zinc finger protein [Tripterygium wilfordii]